MVPGSLEQGNDTKRRASSLQGDLDEVGVPPGDSAHDEGEESLGMSGPAAEFAHVSVMVPEVLAALGREGSPGGLFLDATLGAGGHTEALLEASPGARVIGCDRDPDALRAATERLGRFGERFHAVKASFSELVDAVGDRGGFDGILADLGVSSPQLDRPERGMSFRSEGPLDMRMDPTRGETAAELIRRLSADDLSDVFYYFGEERRARRIARCVKQADSRDELATTLDLRRAVVRAVGPQRVGGVDPATRSFQALRIAVNRELDELEALLNGAPSLLAPGGVLCVISFHSLEDRLVKRAMQSRQRWEPLQRKPQAPGDEECVVNPRARSAKLRAARLVSAEWKKDPEPPTSSGRIRVVLRRGAGGER